MEAEAIAAYKVAKEARGPRVKVSIEGGVAKINHDHPDAFTGTVAVMRAMGTTDRDFFDGLMLQLVNASQGKGPSDNAVDFMVMGGYGHSRLREFVLGGVTHSIFRSMTVPTLMAH